jgi:hypothetical protein
MTGRFSVTKFPLDVPVYSGDVMERQPQKKAIRDVRWTHIEKGSRHNIWRWFQEHRMELNANS